MNESKYIKDLYPEDPKEEKPVNYSKNENLNFVDRDGRDEEYFKDVNSHKWKLKKTKKKKWKIIKPEPKEEEVEEPKPEIKKVEPVKKKKSNRKARRRLRVFLWAVVTPYFLKKAIAMKAKRRRKKSLYVNNR